MPDFLARRRRGNVEPGIARQPDHRLGIGIVHPPRAAIERHLERAVSVRQRPPIWPAASTTITLRFAAITRRAAAMPAAPAPITTMSASRGNGAAHALARIAGVAQTLRTPRESRAASLSCQWFPEL